MNADSDDEDSRFSGELSLSKKLLNQKYIGVLSRLQKKDVKKTLDLLIVLSGPEPNRTQLRRKINRKILQQQLKNMLGSGKNRTARNYRRTWKYSNN